MNGKTAKKLLMRGRVRAFWGQRAYFIVRLPKSVAPGEPEPLTFDGFERGNLAGRWHRPDKSEFIQITEYHTTREPVQDEEWHPVYFPTLDYRAEEPDEDGNHYESWSYWTGARYVRRPGVEGEGASSKDFDKTPLDEETVGAYRARSLWHRSLTELEPASLAPFREAQFWARSTHVLLSGDWMYIRFGVKWHNPKTKLRFCSSVAHAVTATKRAGINVRVLAPPRGS